MTLHKNKTFGILEMNKSVVLINCSVENLKIENSASAILINCNVNNVFVVNIRFLKIVKCRIGKVFSVGSGCKISASTIDLIDVKRKDLRLEKCIVGDVKMKNSFLSSFDNEIRRVFIKDSCANYVEDSEISCLNLNNSNTSILFSKIVFLYFEEKSKITQRGIDVKLLIHKHGDSLHIG